MPSSPSTTKAPYALAFLDDDHDLSQFDCGEPQINDFLRGPARAAQGKDTTTTVLADPSGRVVGFFSLAITRHKRKNVVPPDDDARDQVNVLLIGQLGVDKPLHHQGYGLYLLQQALRACLHLYAQGALPVRAVAIEALRPDLVPFYEELGFRALNPHKPCLLVRSMSDLMADEAL